MNANTPAELQCIYEARFRRNQNYRREVWRVLIEDFFQSLVRPGRRGVGSRLWLLRIHQSNSLR